MVILITGASHAGKTLLAQRLLEKYKYPCFSIDHLKMGLIRSGQTDLTPCDDNELTGYLWPIVREIIKTVIENRQNLIIEGCYIPFDWQSDFPAEYAAQIRYICLIMSEAYIQTHFSDIILHENAIEHRLPDDDLSAELLVQENRLYRQNCQQAGHDFVLIRDEYNIERLTEAAIQTIEKGTGNNGR